MKYIKAFFLGLTCSLVLITLILIFAIGMSNLPELIQKTIAGVLLVIFVCISIFQMYQLGVLMLEGDE